MVRVTPVFRAGQGAGERTAARRGGEPRQTSMVEVFRRERASEGLRFHYKGGEGKGRLLDFRPFVWVSRQFRHWRTEIQV